MNNILGLSVDAPAHHVSLRPFCLWPEFTWASCRLGNSIFDFAYEHRDGHIVGQITNRNDCAFDGVIELTLPEGATAKACKLNGTETEEVQHTERYKRPAVQITDSIAPGRALQLEVHYAR